MAEIKYSINNNTFHLDFIGDWDLNASRPIASDLFAKIEDCSNISFNAEQVASWDNSLIIFCLAIMDKFPEKKYDLKQLTDGIKNLILLSSTNNIPTSRQKEKLDFLTRLGNYFVELNQSLVDIFAFLGAFFVSFGRFMTGKCRYDKGDLWLITKQCGFEALPIVSLTAMLLGLIFTFIGSVQLKMFGAEVYVAGGVTMAMVRVMAAIMTGIVLAGRTGAAFAALIGTMQVNEEIDALKSFGIDPMDFIVLPRVIALSLMTPLLTLYAIVLSIFGGFLIGVFLLGLNPVAYYNNAVDFFFLKHLWLGLFHAFVFGIIIALTGCYQGINCGKSAEDVGRVTTKAVVASILGIIISTSIITVLTTIFEI